MKKSNKFPMFTALKSWREAHNMTSTKSEYDADNQLVESYTRGEK